jgi:hypothetical protein
VDSNGAMAVVGDPLRWIVGTEALRVETEEATEGRLESLRLIEIVERFLSRRPSKHSSRAVRVGIGIKGATMHVGRKQDIQ